MGSLTCSNRQISMEVILEIGQTKQKQGYVTLTWGKLKNEAEESDL